MHNFKRTGFLSIETFPYGGEIFSSKEQVVVVLCTVGVNSTVVNEKEEQISVPTSQLTRIPDDEKPEWATQKSQDIVKAEKLRRLIRNKVQLGQPITFKWEGNEDGVWVDLQGTLVKVCGTYLEVQTLSLTYKVPYDRVDTSSL
jgi:hypothetical protein